MLSGSYNNYFHIYDTEATSDIVLQADKSAFKAKKIGQNKTKPGAKNGSSGGSNNGGSSPGGGNKKVQDTDNIDFQKRIMHASWHPREDTIAIAATNNVRTLFSLVSSLSVRRADRMHPLIAQLFLFSK